MHHIFVGDKPIILTTTVEKESNFKIFLLRTVNIGKVIKLLNTTDLEAVHLVHQNPKKLLKLFLKKLPNVVAGGGKVYNQQGEILFIYRNKKWDLPKGKIEGNESIELTAMREVEEETGVKGLEIVKPLDTTYHIFKRNGNHNIKITYWYEMKTKYDGTLIPEEKEGITEVSWLKPEETDAVLRNSYANIRSLV